jgi:hypothetical protein
VSLIEKDPRDIGYVALTIAIMWYEELSAEVAINLAQGKTHRKPGQRLTPNLFSQMQKIINSPNFTNINSLVKKYRVNKYEIIAAITGDENADEKEVITMLQTEKLLKRLKDIAENCSAANCENCSLDKIMCGDLTLCETLSDTTLDGQGRLNLKRVRQMPDRCPTKDDLTGDVVKKTYRLYKRADDEIHRYIEKNPSEKIQDIISLALLEYVSRKGK